MDMTNETATKTCPDCGETTDNHGYGCLIGGMKHEPVTLEETLPALRPGQKVHFDGQIGYATPDRYVGSRWDGVTYRVKTPSIFPGRERTDLVHRSLLTPA